MPESALHQLGDQPRGGGAVPGAAVVVPPEMAHPQSGGVGAVLQLVARPEPGGERSALQRASVPRILEPGRAEASPRVALPGLADLQTLGAGALLDQPLRASGRAPLV